jgi:hypothetical protein
LLLAALCSLQGCNNCMLLAGEDSVKRGACLDCVMEGKDSWACGQCLTKQTPQGVEDCYKCLQNTPFGASTWPCYS